ncbi:putative secreted protein (Por secretion system target) [Neolewinella xylanilytica]|uniref:Putative secreted protein (Por secretion system target) n=1 Tax=Neolewinella xylanilytica TaxID=1514080 RepID=A0A2S6I8G6_9BACT|nr:T9SS type A sorting domain-containing protein [Neolewinella xylanilytica]PPK87783.1 putative secreted protein (Por secretion system target) [Neolewinella xylanilytica]
MKLSLLSLFLVWGALLAAQQIVPLAEHAQLRRGGDPPAPAALMTCENPDLSGIERIVAGAFNTIRVELDTAGLGSDLTDYRCIGCDEAAFGTVELRNDTVVYTSLPGVGQGLDTLGFTVCSATVCADTTTLVFLVQREGRTIELGNQLIEPESSTEIIVPEPELPGGAFCRTITNCADAYPGRGQRFAFLTDSDAGNDFRYKAARYGGTDTVCVTVCNAYGLCDTYRSTFEINRQPVALPFFDDFSYDDIRPEVALWQDADVLVNRTYGVRPPSIGVATFDAIDYAGQSYQQIGNGRRANPRDYLTSVPIRLAGQSGTVLSFYLQAKGYGNRPEVMDSFLVQFLAPDGEWDTVFSREGLLNTSPNTFLPDFTGESVPVPAAYQYDGFQFRFVNLSTERGSVDNWNLDYVKLSNQSTSLVTQDLALIEEPFRLIAPYTSIPVRHLQAGGQSLLADSIFLKMWNHRADVTPVTASRYRVTDATDGTLVGEGGLIPSPYFGQDNGIAPSGIEVRGATFDQLPSYGAVRNYLFALDPAEDYTLATTYQLTVATEDGGFAPGILRNSTATQLTELADHMAYDDGTAEVAIEGQGGNIIVQRYTAFVADQLIGIRIRLPRVLDGAGDQGITLVVYGEGQDGAPGELLYSADYPLLYPEDIFDDSLQAFTSYALTEAVDLPVGSFFVGWQQQEADRSLSVGFDRNNPLTEGQYFDAGNGWQELEGSTRGAIMIRPLLIGADVRPTATDERESLTEFIRLYPNPTEDVVNIGLPSSLIDKDLRINVYAMDGRLVARQRGTTVVDVSALTPGMYLLECRIGERIGRQKFVRR